MSTARTVGQVGVKYQNSKQQLTPELARSSGVLNVHLEPCSAYMLLQTLLTTVDTALTDFGSVESLYIPPVSIGFRLFLSGKPVLEARKDLSTDRAIFCPSHFLCTVARLPRLVSKPSSSRDKGRTTSKLNTR